MKSPPISQPPIRYADFMCICPVVNPADFFGFRVEIDGVYTIVPGKDVVLMPKERAVLSWHPTVYYDQPALAFPCTVAQLRTFVTDTGLAGCIDETAIADLTKVSGAAPVLAPEMVANFAMCTPLPKQRTQETKILQLLQEQGHDPSKLPTRTIGKSGVKSEIRAIALVAKPMIFSKNSFDKAWQRLR
ncbi:MAG: hypothetical protein WCJ49_08620, partial [Deltaproteobacteria bacterium]